MNDKEKMMMVVDYMRRHWPSAVKEEWQVGVDEYSDLVAEVVRKWTRGATKVREMVRIAGISGSGKTTQLLPAVKEYFATRGKRPVLVAARRFVPYHPHYDEILAEYGQAKLREMTDEFATIMMFLVLGELTRRGCDIILDVTLLDPKMEGILLAMLTDAGYTHWLTMVALAPEIAEGFLGQREWRHSRETEQEFLRVTRMAMKFYAVEAPEMRVVLWNVWDREPIYDGPMRGALEVYDAAAAVTVIPEGAQSDEARKEAKMEFFAL